MGVIGILPKDAGVWHGSRQAAVYDCVMGIGSRAPGHAEKSFGFKEPKASPPATGAYLFPAVSRLPIVLKSVT
jgi:hypothetical protein